MAGQDYVGEKTVGLMLSQTFSLYFKNFGKLFPIILILAAPLSYFYALLVFGGTLESLLFGVLILIGGSFFYQAAFTVAISDICLDHPTGVKRAYGEIFYKLKWKLFKTFFLVLLIYFLILGFAGFFFVLAEQSYGEEMLYISLAIILIIGLFVFGVRVITVMPIVVLEKIDGFKALKRSNQLGKGKHLRNFGAILVIGIITNIFIYPFDLVLLPMGTFASFAIYTLMVFILYSFQSVLVVLLYYDLRSRKEGYDLKALEGELMH